MLDRRKIEPPARPAVLEHQVLHQEGALGRIGYRGGKAGFGFGAAFDAGEVEFAHRPNMRQVMRRVIDRGDVDDHEALDLGAVLQRRDHRRLAPHAVAEQRITVVAARVQRRAYVLRHLGIVHRVSPGRGAMIAQVDSDDPMMHGEALGDRCPVAAGAE